MGPLLFFVGGAITLISFVLFFSQVAEPGPPPAVWVGLAGIVVGLVIRGIGKSQM